MVWRRFGLILFMLGALALGGTGYASGADLDAAMASDMTEMMDHECCPEDAGQPAESDMNHAQPCDEMDGCSGSPCSLTSSLSTLIPGDHTVRMTLTGIELGTNRAFLEPVSNSPDNLDRPPRA